VSLGLFLAIDGLDHVIASLDRLEGGFFQAQQAVIRPLGERYLATLQAETPLGQGERPGRLRSGYRTREHYSDTSGEYQITNETPHLGVVLRGRGPIVAERGRALRFVIRGVVLFRKRVGPAAPNPFPSRARQAMQPAIDRAPAALAAALVSAYEGRR
jgi:hypothetical protein